MKLIQTSFWAITFFVLATLCSCHKSEDHSDHQNMLNVDFPAAFVVNGGSNNISVINLNEGKERGTISLNGATFPHHIYLNPAKTKLAVAITSKDLSGGHGDHGGSSAGLKVQILDCKTGMIEKEIALNKLPHNGIFNPNGSELWIGQFDTVQSAVLVYSTTDWSLKNTIKVGKGLSEVTFSGNGSMAFAANTMDGTVSMIDPSTKTVVKTITVGLDPVGAWPGIDGNMYADNEKSQSISVIEFQTGTVTNTITLGYKPGYVAQRKNNEWVNEIWVSDATNGKVAVYTLSGGNWNQIRNIPTGSDPHGIAVSKDGTKAYVTNQGSGSLSVINTSTYAKIQDIVVGSKPNGIALKD